MHCLSPHSPAFLKLEPTDQLNLLNVFYFTKQKMYRCAKEPHASVVVGESIHQELEHFGVSDGFLPLSSSVHFSGHYKP